MSKLAILVLIPLLTSVVGVSLAGTPSAPNTPQQILAAANSNGVDQVVRALTKSGNWQSTVLPGVKAALPDWLNVVHKLYSATDGGTREDLDGALADALLEAPYKVLPLLKEIWWGQSETMCIYGYDSELPGGVEKYVQHLKKKLEKSPPAHIATLRESCARGIAVTLADLRKHEN